MTVYELIGTILPFLGAVVLVILIILGVQAIGILWRVKRLLERVDVLSDINHWGGIVRQMLSKKKKTS
jgi:hypothetical protein